MKPKASLTHLFTITSQANPEVVPVVDYSQDSKTSKADDYCIRIQSKHRESEALVCFNETVAVAFSIPGSQMASISTTVRRLVTYNSLCALFRERKGGGGAFSEATKRLRVKSKNNIKRRRDRTLEEAN